MLCTNVYEKFQLSILNIYFIKNHREVERRRRKLRKLGANRKHFDQAMKYDLES